jgi:hypothetical protein
MPGSDGIVAPCNCFDRYPHVPGLNEILYLHYKGITKLENLEVIANFRL